MKTGSSTCEHASQMGRREWSQWDWSFIFLPRPGNAERWLNSIKDKFSSSRYNHSCLPTALIGCFHFPTLRRKKKGSKWIPCRSICKCGQLAGSQPWRRLFSGKRPKISNHTVFNHHFIYISSLPKVKGGTRRSTSRSEPLQIPLRNLLASYFSHCPCPTRTRLLIDKAILIYSLQQNRSLSHVRVLGERLSRQLIHQII